MVIGLYISQGHWGPSRRAHSAVCATLALLLAASTARAQRDRGKSRATVTIQKSLAGLAPMDVAAPPSDAKRTASGVFTKVLKKGHGAARLAESDCARVRLTGWKSDGSIFSTSGLHQESEIQCVSTAMPGVAEALRTMAAGERRRIWIPAKRTSSATGLHCGQIQKSKEEMDADAEGTGDLTFDVELLKVLKAPPVPPDLKAPPRTAFKTPSGLAFRVLKRGTGKRHPSLTSQVKVHFSGWTGDGKLISSTQISGEPAVYLVGAAPPGWREGLQQMVVGERVRLWVPSSNVYANDVANPGKNLVYEIELLALQ